MNNDKKVEKIALVILAIVLILTVLILLVNQKTFVNLSSLTKKVVFRENNKIMLERGFLDEKSIIYPAVCGAFVYHFMVSAKC